ncbi:MAG TPA: glycosyltransferase family 4 protein [Mycobacteriales bacterium]|nr:glycosyltransferase family 4 protein [Mycobacteriales bacterium]
MAEAEPLRVALVLPSSRGGIGQHCLMLARHLVAGGDEVTVAAPEETLERFDFASAGARVVVDDAGSPVGWLHRIESGAVLRGQQIVHAHGVRVGARLVVAGIAPLVVTWHNAPLGGLGRRAAHVGLERLSARAAAVLVASEDLGDRARRAGASDVRFCPVAAPALAATMPTVTGVPQPDQLDERPVILAVARLHRQKRLDLLVSAAAGWSKLPVQPRIVVAGDGPERGRLTALARRLGVPLELLGHREDIATLLSQATVLVLPSDWEARPLVVQEALRAGVPVVATAVGGVPGLVADAALLVPRGDAVALRTAIERVLTEADLRRRLCAAGPKQARTWPSEAEMVTAVRQTYLEVKSRVS